MKPNHTTDPAIVADAPPVRADRGKMVKPKPGAPAGGYPARGRLAPTPKTDNRPYTLESSNLESELNRQRLAALSEIEAIEANILAIEQTANRDKELIQAKADNEIAARRFRADDLNKIVGMVDKATAPAVQPNDLQPTEWRQVSQIGAPAQAITNDERQEQMRISNIETLQEAIEVARREAGQ